MAKYIIGSIHKITGLYSIAQTPEQHNLISEAEKESKRLARQFPEKDFVVMKLESIASMPNPEVTVRKM